MTDEVDRWGASRSQRRRRSRGIFIGVSGTLLVLVLALTAALAGRQLDPASSGAVTVVSYPPTTARVRAAAPIPRTTATTVARPSARLITLITRDVAPGPEHDRVYLIPGQLSAKQARAGLRPTIFVRPGERIQIRVDNQDSVDHTWTFAGTRVNVTAWKHSTETSQTFRAPRAVGSYDFFCAFRKAGMNGRVVVTD